MVSQAFEQNVLKPCPHCQRTFLEDRLSIHLRSCTAENPHKTVRETVSPQRKRPQSVNQVTFPVSASRTAQDFLSSNREERTSTPSRHRAQQNHTDARPSTPSKLRVPTNVPDGRPSTSSKINAPQSYVQCQYCTRFFDPKVADRHIPICKDIINKPKPPPESTGFSRAESPLRKTETNANRMSFQQDCTSKKNYTERNDNLGGNRDKVRTKASAAVVKSYDSLPSNKAKNTTKKVEFAKEPSIRYIDDMDEMSSEEKIAKVKYLEKISVHEEQMKRLDRLKANDESPKVVKEPREAKTEARGEIVDKNSNQFCIENISIGIKPTKTATVDRKTPSVSKGVGPVGIVPITSNKVKNKAFSKNKAPEIEETKTNVGLTNDEGERPRLFCYMCGEKYFPKANFCSFCGSKKQ